MRREERVMEIIGRLDDKYISEALPKKARYDIKSEPDEAAAGASYSRPAGNDIRITKKDIRMYRITRALGIAAALVLVVGGGVWLWKNWDKIAVSGSDRPGVVTTVSENAPTPVTDGIVYKYDGCTVKVKEYEFDGLTARVIYEEIFDKDPGYDLQPRVSPCIADSDKELGGKPHKLIKKDGLVYTWETSCTQYEPSEDITLAFIDWSVSFEDYKAMKTDPAYSLVISKGNVPACVIETGKAIPLTAGNVNVEAVYICENTVTVKCEPSGLTDEELIELADADIKIIMTDGYEVQFALEPNTVNPARVTADGYAFTGRYNAGHIDTSMIRSVYINDVLIYNDTSIHDTWTQEYQFTLTDSYLFTDEVFGIFEDVFYGEWEPAEGNNADQNIILTYSKDMFTFENWIYPFIILENDEAYVMPYMSCGVPECLIIRKDDPRVLYKGWWNRTDSNADYFTDTVQCFGVDPAIRYNRINDELYDRELQTGEIGVWGLLRLISGGEQSNIRPRFAEETYYTIPGGFYGGGYSIPGGFDGRGYFIDEDGTEWVISGTKALDPSKMYYLGGDGITSLTLGIRYYEKAAYETYVNEHINDAAYEPEEQYFAVSFIVDENGLCRVDYSPYETERIIEVRKPGKKIELSVNTVLDLDAVTADCTYKLIEDYESCETWQYMKDWVENSEAEKAAELRDLFRNTDYFGYPDYDIQYIGNDACDYVIRKQFGFADIVQYNSWEMFIFVKDGRAVGATDIMKRSGLNWYVDGNDLYEVATTENILHIDLTKLEYDWIPIKEGYATIADINDDWFICGNGPLYAYNRHTGEIINTGMDWNGLYSNLMRLNGDRIEYTGEAGTGYWYDIVTGESGEDPGIFNTPIHFVFENSEYKAHSYYNTTAEPSAGEFDFSRISITRKSDGLTKVFDFNNLLGGRSGETEGYTLNHLFIGDWFIIRLNNYGRIAVNFETGESAAVNDILKDYRIWNHTVCADRNFVGFTDESGTAHLFGEIVYEVTDK